MDQLLRLAGIRKIKFIFGILVNNNCKNKREIIFPPSFLYDTNFKLNADLLDMDNTNPILSSSLGIYLQRNPQKTYIIDLGLELSQFFSDKIILLKYQL